MGGALVELIAEAGFVDIAAQRADRVDMAYTELARYVGDRVQASLDDVDTSDDDRRWLREAGEAAERWSMRTGTFTQCWIEVTARWPGAVSTSPRERCT